MKSINQELYDRRHEIKTSKQLHDFWEEKNIVEKRIITLNDLEAYDTDFQECMFGCTVNIVESHDYGDKFQGYISYLDEFGFTCGQGETQDEAFKDVIYIIDLIKKEFAEESEFFNALKLLKYFQNEKKKNEKTDSELIQDIVKKFRIDVR